MSVRDGIDSARLYSMSGDKLAVGRVYQFRFVQEVMPFVLWVYIACFAIVPFKRYFSSTIRFDWGNFYTIYASLICMVLVYLCVSLVMRRLEGRKIRKQYNEGLWVVTKNDGKQINFERTQKVHSLRFTHTLLIVIAILEPFIQSTFDEASLCFVCNLIACGVYALTERRMYVNIHRWFVYFFEPGRDYCVYVGSDDVRINDQSTYLQRLGELQGTFGVWGTIAQVHNGRLAYDRRYNSVWGHRYIIVVDLHKDIAFSLDYHPNFYVLEDSYTYSKAGYRMSGATGDRDFKRESASRRLITRTLHQVLSVGAEQVKLMPTEQAAVQPEEISSSQSLQDESSPSAENIRFAQCATNPLVASQRRTSAFDRIYDVIHAVALAIYAFIPPGLLVWYMATTHSVPRSAQDWQTMGVLTLVYVGYLGLIVLCQLFHVYATVGLSIILTIIIANVVGQVVSPYLAVVGLYAVLWTIFWGKYRWSLVRYKIGLRADLYKYNRTHPRV